MMREGVHFSSYQVSPSVFMETFEQYAAQGCDILYVGCSSTLSASYRGSLTARDEFIKTHPETKVICIDGLRACTGLGIHGIAASRLRSEGVTHEA